MGTQEDLGSLFTRGSEGSRALGQAHVEMGSDDALVTGSYQTASVLFLRSALGGSCFQAEA